MRRRGHVFLIVLICAVMLSGCGLLSASGGNSSKTTQAPAASKGMYAYECLDDKEKLVYNNMEYSLTNHLESIEVETIPDENMKKVFYFVLKDHPEIFWCTSFNRNSTKYVDGSVKTEFIPVYTQTKQERYDYKEQIDKTADSWLAKIPAGADDFQKVKIIFDTIVSEVEYVAGSEENQNIISVFVNRQSVCQGYAKAFQYLLSKVGIESTLVKGTAKNESHAWNIVKLDGEYYYFDVTWGDPAFASNKEISNYINYAYFGVTSEEIAKSHVIDDELTLPECNATKDNYYVHEKLFFNVKNKNIVGDAIYSADIDRKNFVSMKFDSDDTYKWAVDYFITNNHVFDFCTFTKRVFMYNNEELKVLSIIFQQQ